MKHAMLATVLVLAGCVSYDTEPCDTLGCLKRVEFKKCMRGFSAAKMRRPFVDIYPDDDPIYQMDVCRRKVAKIRVF